MFYNQFEMFKLILEWIHLIEYIKCSFNWIIYNSAVFCIKYYILIIYQKSMLYLLFEQFLNIRWDEIESNSYL